MNRSIFLVVLMVLLFISPVHSTGQMTMSDFEEKANEFFYKYVTTGKVHYGAIKQNSMELDKLVAFYESTKLDSLVGNEKLAFLINVYNLSVINQIIKKYPKKSPMDIAGFFDINKFTLAGKKLTLNYLENELIRKQFKDPRIHFVLVCGAIGCPVIINQAYTADSLEIQMERQTAIAINNTQFIYKKETTFFISEIFKWYKDDFGTGSKGVVNFINKYRKKKIGPNDKIDYYPYNWSINEFKGKINSITIEEIQQVEERLPLNVDSKEVNLNLDSTKVLPAEIHDVALVLEEERSSTENLDAPILEQLTTEKTPDNSIDLQTYTAGTLLHKGQFDFTLFNSIYTETKMNWLGQDFEGNRTTLFTSSLQVLYGISKSRRVNLGVEVNYKSTGRSSDANISSITDAFTLENNEIHRSGIANVGLRVKVIPFKDVTDFSIQSTFYVPTIANPEGYTNPDGSGNGNLTWSDWNRYVSWTQFFYTKSYAKSQLFAEVDFLYRRRITSEQIDHVDLPLTLIYSYFPTERITLYGIGQHSTRFLYDIMPEVSNDWLQPMNYSTLGLGFKYQLKENITLELLYTNFIRGVNTGLGSTFNVGIKILTL
jgi:hypothetical protein